MTRLQGLRISVSIPIGTTETYGAQVPGEPHCDAHQIIARTPRAADRFAHALTRIVRVGIIFAKGGSAMEERRVSRDGIELHARRDGPADSTAPTLVFSNALGTDLTVWEPLLPHLPKAVRLIRYDMRGHGRSSVPGAPYHMGALVSDAEAVCDAFDVRNGLFVGLSVGGLIAQGLAVKRLDIVRALVLSNTATKIGHPQMWEERIATIRDRGVAGLADGVLERWFSGPFLQTDAVASWRALLLSTPAEGYAGVCHAIAGIDFYSTTATLRLPTLGIAGTEDGSTPPDMVRETTELVPGARFEVIRGAGHLPFVEKPEAYATHLTDFMEASGLV